MATITLTPTACTSALGQWIVLYSYLSTNSSSYPRQLIFTYPASSELSSEGVNITSVTIHGYVRNSASALKQLRIGFRTSDTAGVAEWASIDGADVLESAFNAIDGWDTSGYGYAAISRSYSGNSVFAKWIKQQFRNGQPLYMGVIQPQSGKSISVWNSLDAWAIDIEYELLGNIPTVNKSTVKLTESITTTVNRIIADSTTTLKYKIGENTLSTVNIGTATSHTFTLSRAAGTYFPTALTATLTVEAVTSVSNTEYGTISTTATITLPDDAAPTATLYKQTRVWVSGVNSSNTISAYVQNKCGYRAQLTVSYKYGSSIVSQKAVCEGNEVAYSNNWFYYYPFTTSGDVSTTFTITDSRGLTGTLTIINTVLPWAPPEIQTFAINRSTSDGTIAIDGTCATADATASSSSLITGMTKKISAEWLPQQSGSGDPSLTNIRQITGLMSLMAKRQDGNVYSTGFSDTIYGGTFDENGNGTKTWSIDTLTGNETWHTSSYGTGRYWAWPNNTADAMETSSTDAEKELICDRFIAETFDNYKSGTIGVTHDSTFCFCTEFTTVDEWKAYLAEQYANGTPVQIAYKMGTASTFTATALTVAMNSKNDTFTCNADTFTLVDGSAGTENNTLTFLVQYREIGATDWLDADTITATSISSSISGLLTSSDTVIDTFADMTGYEFRLCVSDLYATSYATDEMPTKEQYWDIDESTGRMGFGGDAPKEDDDFFYRFHKPVDLAGGYKIYSTQEVDTGNTWIDGTGIFRTVIQTTTDLVGAIGKVGELPSYIKYPVSFRAFAKYPGDGAWRPVPDAYHGGNTWNVLVYFKDNEIYMGFGSSWTGTKDLIIIMEYTKVVGGTPIMSNADVISVSRGTCLSLPVNMVSDGTAVTMEATDYLVLTVREIASESSPILLQVTGEKGSNIITLHEEDTASLAVGKYSAEIRLYHYDCVYSVWGIDSTDTREKNLRNFVVLAGVGE